MVSKKQVTVENKRFALGAYEEGWRPLPIDFFLGIAALLFLLALVACCLLLCERWKRRETTP